MLVFSGYWSLVHHKRICFDIITPLDPYDKYIFFTSVDNFICMDGFQKCLGEPKCYSETRKCDGTPDCTSGEDELNCGM